MRFSRFHTACLSLTLLAAGRSAAAEPMHMPAPRSVLPAPASDAAPAALALADLENLALANNPTLAQAAATIEHSRAMAQQAGLYPNPTVGYVGDLMGVNGTAGELQGGFIQQTIITAGKLRLSRAKYNQAAVEAEIRALAQQLKVINGVHVRFYEVLAVQRMVDVRRQMLDNSEESLRTYKEMANAGQASRAEVLIQEADLQRTRVALRAEENRYRSAWAHLAALVGQPCLPPQPLAGHLEPEGPPLECAPTLDRLLAESPHLQLAHAHVVYDQITLKREKVQPIPDIQIQANTGYNFENPGTVAGAQIGFEVPLFDRNQGTIRQVQADLARSFAQVTRVELWLRQQFAETFSKYQTALETSQAYRDSILPQTTEAYEIHQDMYKKRRLPWPKVVEMQRELLRAQSEYTDSLIELRRTEVMLKGLLTVDGLEEPPGATPGGHLEVTPKPR